MKKSEKNLNTGLRILEILKILLEQDLSKGELIKKLKDNYNVGNVYTYEAFIKYFNTLEKSGLKLSKSKKIYKLSNALLRIDLSKKEKDALFELLKNFKKLNNKKAEDTFENIVHKISKYVDEDINCKFEEVIKLGEEINTANIKNNLVSILKTLLADNQLITVTYKKSTGMQETIVAELKEIIQNGSNYFAVFYNREMGRNRKINIDSIISMKQSPRKVSGITGSNSVVFELYGRLAASYKLKQYEKMLNFSANCRTISNFEKDRDSLLLRLLKYGENCRIISPKSFRDEFISLTEQMIKNLESGQ